MISSNLNAVVGNRIGTNPAGTAARGNGISGVFVNGGGNNQIGNTTGGNLLSGNTFGGVQIEGTGATFNTVKGNLIGTDVTGTEDLGNGGGVILGAVRDDTTIGGSTSVAERNIISGNGAGVESAGAARVTILGNYVGTTIAGIAGTTPLGNGTGLNILAAVAAQIGDGTALGTNVVSGNTRGIVFVDASSASPPVVRRNIVGLDKDGVNPVPNVQGISVEYSPNINIGDGTANGRNVISGNTGDGIEIFDTDGAAIHGNYIGLAADGTTPRGNTLTGIHLFNGANNVMVGGTTTDDRNVIASNGGAGLFIDAVFTTQVGNNYIGLNAAGTALRSNGTAGIHDAGAFSQIGVVSGAVVGNVVAGAAATGQSGPPGSAASSATRSTRTRPERRCWSASAAVST